MSDYLVQLRLVIGEFEKTDRCLVTDAPSEESAGEMALILECHGNDESISFEDKGMIWDMYGEMAYRVQSVRKVRGIELAVLKKYLGAYTFDQDDIDRVVNTV